MHSFTYNTGSSIPTVCYLLQACKWNSPHVSVYCSSTLVPETECGHEKNTIRLNVSSSKLQKFGDTAFSVPWPRVLNELPCHIRESSSVVSFELTFQWCISFLKYSSFLMAWQGRMQPMECIVPYTTLHYYYYYYFSIWVSFALYLSLYLTSRDPWNQIHFQDTITTLFF